MEICRMKFKEGDKSKGICAQCTNVVSTTMKFSDVVLLGVKTNLLISSCDVCGNLVAIPNQNLKKRLKNKRTP
jgi:hypothetical protein